MKQLVLVTVLKMGQMKCKTKRLTPSRARAAASCLVSLVISLLKTTYVTIVAVVASIVRHGTYKKSLKNVNIYPKKRVPLFYG